jgi:hypothetical protein
MNDSLAVKIITAISRGAAIAKIGREFWKIAQATDAIVAAPILPSI